MKKEKSCGSIIIRDGKILIVKHGKGHWGIPKGHVQDNETEIETAIRETMEETGLKVEVDPLQRYEVHYIIEEDNIDKTVVFFMAKKVEGDLKIHDSEITTIEWATLDEAAERVKYDAIREMLKQLKKDLGCLA